MPAVYKITDPNGMIYVERRTRQNGTLDYFGSADSQLIEQNSLLLWCPEPGGPE